MVPAPQTKAQWYPLTRYTLRPGGICCSPKSNPEERDMSSLSQNKLPGPNQWAPHNPTRWVRWEVTDFACGQDFFFPTPTPACTKSEGLGRSWKKKFAAHAKLVAAHRTHRVGWWGGHWFGPNCLSRLVELISHSPGLILRLPLGHPGRRSYRAGL